MKARTWGVVGAAAGLAVAGGALAQTVVSPGPARVLNAGPQLRLHAAAYQSTQLPLLEGQDEAPVPPPHFRRVVRRPPVVIKTTAVQPVIVDADYRVRAEAGAVVRPRRPEHAPPYPSPTRAPGR